MQSKTHLKEQTMSRYIDADAIEDKAKQYSLGYYEEDEWAVPFKEITSAPSIDIVRCKECKHRNERCGMGEHRWCEMLNMSTTPDDFCSYGEVRDE